MNKPNVTPIRSVETYDDGTVFERLEGRIEWVDDPKPPSEAQLRKGLHIQEIRVGDDHQNSIKIRILKREMHIDRAAKGTWFAFESTFESGKSMGLVKQSWTNKDGQTFHSVELNAKARIFPLRDQPPAPGQQQPPVQQQPPPPAQQQVPRDQQFPSGVKTVEDHAEEWLRIFAIVQPMAEAAGVPESQWGALTTHVRMEFRGRGAIFRQQVTAQNGAPSAGGQQANPEQWKQMPADHSGALIYDLPHNDLCLMISDLASYQGDDQVKLQQKNAAARTMMARNLSWTEIYDALAGALKRRFPSNVVDQVHDMQRGTHSDVDENEFYKMLILNREDFVSNIEIAAKQ